ncbi:hypothetical protein [Yimella sp. NH-Cas1]|uniref:hypothetical protein n=1 Tax=Yimella sp. NH-Cas1 TaxID=2917726 RepID=UPI001EFBCA2E|nr:hypothetical protein [Yimella sp. NH-Cas1]MCG8654831.1 hypothetical protein [Yimella sp. NH-Cas1]
MWILLLTPFALIALSQLVALVALAREASGTGLDAVALGAPAVAYLSAAVLSLAAVVLAGLPDRSAGGGPREALIALAVIAAALVCAAPLLWGRTIGAFHLSHHVVRATLVAAALVLYSWYVAAHR